MLLEAKRRVDRPGDDEQVADRLMALRVGDRVVAALGDRHPYLLACSHVRDEARRVDAAGSQLEMWVTRPGERARAEERAAQIRAAAAGAPDDPFRRHSQRSARAGEDAGLAQGLVGVLVNLH